MKVPTVRQEESQPPESAATQDETSHDEVGFSLAEAVKKFNETQIGYSRGDQVKFGGIDPKPLTVEEFEIALKRILSQESEESISAELLAELRGVSESKRVPEDFSISPGIGITPNDFTKITGWRIMLAYKPSEKKNSRAFIIRDWDDEKNQLADSAKPDAPSSDPGKMPEISKPYRLSGKVTGVVARPSTSWAVWWMLVLISN